jgi:hypothetical protein
MDDFGHRTKCPLLTVFFFSFFLSAAITFLTEGVIVGFRNFAWGYKSKKKIRVGANFRIPEMKMKIDQKVFQFF